MTRAAGDAIADAIEAWAERLEMVAQDGSFEQIWAEAWSWITHPAVAPGIDALLDSDSARWAGALAPFQRRFLAIRESREAERLASAHGSLGAPVSEWVHSDFGRQTYDRVAEVLRLADFAACRRFVMVGCGPFPAAALFVRDATDVPEIVAIDVDSRATAAARRLVAALGERRIRIDDAGGEAYDYGAADIVYLANQVCGKARVLERFRDTASAEAVVIVREPYGVGRLVAESVERCLPTPFRAVSVGENRPAFYSRHVLLTRDAD
jgi:hypothetical protein